MEAAQETFAPSCEVGGGFPVDQESSSSNCRKQGSQNWDPSQYESLLKGGEQVTFVLKEMAKLVSFVRSFSHNLPGHNLIIYLGLYLFIYFGGEGVLFGLK